jgi:hypothetical protein
MSDREPLTIEILGGSEISHPIVLDRVIGGTIHMDEAKRIGRHLLSIADGGVVRPQGFRILGPRRELLYAWRIGDNEPKLN